MRVYRSHDGLRDMFYDIFSGIWDEQYLHDIENMFGQLLLTFEQEGRRVDGSDESHTNPPHKLHWQNLGRIFP